MPEAKPIDVTPLIVYGLAASAAARAIEPSTVP
jgi:hypothetical protein